jgi:formylmethanofuran dehydrogenase subunit E
VKAPVFDPNQQQVQQAQHMTCKACGALIIGVFVRIKGEPLHPECFRCVKCGKNLKNQGYFTVEGKMYCEADARNLSNPNDPDSFAVPVYR